MKLNFLVKFVISVQFACAILFNKYSCFFFFFCIIMNVNMKKEISKGE